MWATQAIEKLKLGESVTITPRGNSMLPRVKSGQSVVVNPIPPLPQVGDVVLCKVNGRQYLHLVKAIRGAQYQIANNRGHINGWTSQVYGVAKT